MKTIYVTIGNSDDRLTQVEWSVFCASLSILPLSISGRPYFHYGHSLPSAEQQNACISFQVVYDADVDAVRRRLVVLARRFGQDSIAFVVVDSDAVEMIGPDTQVPPPAGEPRSKGLARGKTPRQQREEFQAKQADFIQRSAGQDE